MPLHGFQGNTPFQPLGQAGSGHVQYWTLCDWDDLLTFSCKPSSITCQQRARVFFLREAKRIIPNGLTRDGPSNIPQSLPLVSKPISNHHKMDIVTKTDVKIEMDALGSFSNLPN